MWVCAGRGGGFGPQLFGSGMNFEFPFAALSLIGFGSLLSPWRPAPVPSPAAVVICDCPSPALWFVAGIGLGLALGIAVVCFLAALLRPGFGPAPWTRPREEEIFEDVVEGLAAPAAAYRRR